MIQWTASIFCCLPLFLFPQLPGRHRWWAISETRFISSFHMGNSIWGCFWALFSTYWALFSTFLVLFGLWNQYVGDGNIRDKMHFIFPHKRAGDSIWGFLALFYSNFLVLFLPMNPICGRRKYQKQDSFHLSTRGAGDSIRGFRCLTKKQQKNC